MEEGEQGPIVTLADFQIIKEERKKTALGPPTPYVPRQQKSYSSAPH